MSTPATSTGSAGRLGWDSVPLSRCERKAATSRCTAPVVEFILACQVLSARPHCLLDLILPAVFEGLRQHLNLHRCFPNAQVQGVGLDPPPPVRRGLHARDHPWREPAPRFLEPPIYAYTTYIVPISKPWFLGDFRVPGPRNLLATFRSDRPVSHGGVEPSHRPGQDEEANEAGGRESFVYARLPGRPRSTSRPAGLSARREGDKKCRTTSPTTSALNSPSATSMTWYPARAHLRCCVCTCAT